MESYNAYAKPATIISIDDILADLKSKGYTRQFRRATTCLYCPELNLWITQDQFFIDAVFHFEEMSTPDIDRMLYAISLPQGIMGLLVDTCGVYMDNISAEMMKKLKLNGKSRS